MKKVALIFFLAIVVGIGIYVYLTRQIHYLPDWYKEEAQEQTPQDVPPPETPPPSAVKAPTPPPRPEKKALPPEKVVEKLRRENTVRIDEETLSEMIRSAVAERFPNEQANFLKAVRSDIQKDKLTVEMVVDMEKIPWEQLPKQYRFAREYVKRFTGGRSSEVYVQFSGKPEIVGDRLLLDEDATVTIGKMAYSLKTLTTLLGLGDQFAGEIPIKNIPFSAVTLEEDALILEK